MKIARKIIFGIFLFIVLLIAAIVAWQWDNINAFYIGFTNNETQIQDKIDKNKQKFTEILEKEEILDKKVVDGFSKEDEEKIAKGEITVEQAVDKLFEEEPKDDQANNTASDVDSKDEVTAPDQIDAVAQKQKDLMQTAVKEMYVLKATFTKQLADIERYAKRVYIADGQNGMTMEKKLQIADQLMPQFVQAEKDCDAKVEKVLKTLYDGLKELGKDTSVVDSIREQYKEEKKLKKTQYIKDYL